MMPSPPRRAGRQLSRPVLLEWTVSPSSDREIQLSRARLSIIKGTYPFPQIFFLISIVKSSVSAVPRRILGCRTPRLGMRLLTPPRYVLSTPLLFLLVLAFMRDSPSSAF